MEAGSLPVGEAPPKQQLVSVQTQAGNRRPPRAVEGGGSVSRQVAGGSCESVSTRLSGIFVRERKWISEALQLGAGGSNWLPLQRLAHRHSRRVAQCELRVASESSDGASVECGVTWPARAEVDDAPAPASYEIAASARMPDNNKFCKQGVAVGQQQQQPSQQWMIDSPVCGPSVERVNYATQQQQQQQEEEPATFFSHKQAASSSSMASSMEFQSSKADQEHTSRLSSEPQQNEQPQPPPPHQWAHHWQDQQQWQDSPARLNQAAAHNEELASAAGPTSCRCHACLYSLWPARLRIVGPVTMRRSCRRSEELKVIRTCCGEPASRHQLAGLKTPAPAATMSRAAIDTQGSLRHHHHQHHNNNSRSMSLSGFSCPVVLVGGSSRPSVGGEDELPEAGSWASDETRSPAPRCKANSISSCIEPAIAVQRRQQQRHRLLLYNNTKNRCLVCELGARRKAADTRKSAAAAEPRTNNNNNKRDYLKPSDCFLGPTQPARPPKRRHSWICSHGDEPIVTPFAQILASLRNVGHNLLHLFNLPTPVLRERETRRPSSSLHAAPSQAPVYQAMAGAQSPQAGGQPKPQPQPQQQQQQQSQQQPPSQPQACNELLEDHLYEETINRLKLDTLEEHYWCLSQLEAIRSHKSMGDLALSKFSRMLDKELSHVPESKSGKQISGYLRSFLGVDKQPEELDLSYLTTTTASNQQQKVDLNPQRLHQQLAEALLAGEQQQHQVSLATPCKSPSDLLSSMSLSDGAPMRPRSPSAEVEKRQQLVASTGISAVALKQPERMQQLQRLLKQTGSLEELPAYGVECSNEEQLDALMKQIDVWGLNIFEVHQCSREHSLTVVMYTIFQKRNLMNTFNISSASLVNYMLTLEAHYLNVPYHNSMHAADVSQSVHVLLLSPALESVFSDLEIMTALFAAAIHDVDHPGVTNQYLIDSGSELALMYNDESVLENHSLAVAFKLLQQEGCDFLANLSKKNRQTLRRMAIDMVLATDMSKHMSLLADFKTMVETKKVAGDGILLLDQYTERIQVLQNMLHCADLSNPTKHLDIYRQWVDRVMDEFHQQGDNERNQNLQISPMCDRLNANVEKSQVYFIDFIVHPLWETWAELVQPDAQAILENLQVNREWFYSQLQPDSPAAETQSGMDSTNAADGSVYLDNNQEGSIVLHPDINSLDEQSACSCGAASRRTSDEPETRPETEQTTDSSNIQIRLEEPRSK